MQRPDLGSKVDLLREFHVLVELVDQLMYCCLDFV